MTPTAPRLGVRNVAPILVAAALASVLLHLALVEAPGSGGASAPAGQVAQAYGELPLSFQPNRGQLDRRVRFYSGGAGYGLFLSSRGAVLALGSAARRGSPATQRQAAFSMSLLGAAPRPRISGAGRLIGRVSYFRGREPRHWRIGIPTFSAVRYAGVWPGVGMTFHGNRRRLEYDFDLAAGADAGAIGLRFDGQRRIRLDRSGDLVLTLGGGTVRELRPRAFQTVGGERRPIPSRYELLGAGRVGIRLGAHDPRRPLVIDPQLVYSSYLGGAFKYGDSANAIAVDHAGDAYVTGSSYYSKFPVTPGAFQPHAHPVGPFDTEGFVTEFDPSGGGLVYSTYLGGKGHETVGYGIAVDRAGDAYVTGRTTAPGFPTTPGAFRSTGTGAFVTKLNPKGARLVYSTLLGETSGVGPVAVDESGAAYVGGGGAGLPTTPGAFLASGEGAFVAKLKPDGSGLAYSTYLNAAKYAAVTGIALDPAGEAYVSGVTSAPGFPTTPGAFSAAGSGAFVAKLKADGSGFAYSTLLGPESSAGGIAVDAMGNAYVTGNTSSAEFPTTQGALRTHGRGIFVTKLNPDGTALAYSTLLGPQKSGADGIAIDDRGDAFIAGTTAATDFPTTPGAFQRKAGGFRGDAFVSELDPSGGRLVYSTYLGGTGDDAGLDLALGPGDHVYLTGRTISSDFPTTPGAFQPKSRESDGYAAFVAQVDPSGALVPGLSVVAASHRGDRIVLTGRLDAAARGRLHGSARWRGRSVPVATRRRRAGFTAAVGPLRGSGLLKLRIRFRGAQRWEGEEICRSMKVSAARPRRGAPRLPIRRC